MGGAITAARQKDADTRRPILMCFLSLSGLWHCSFYEDDQAADNQEEGDNDEIDPDMDGRYRVEMAEMGSSEGDPGSGEA